MHAYTATANTYLFFLFLNHWSRRPSLSSTNNNAPILTIAPKKSQEANPLGFSDAELAVLKEDNVSENQKKDN